MNYPDDIRRFDHDPRSPFHCEGPVCPDCNNALKVEPDEEGSPSTECAYCDAIEMGICPESGCLGELSVNVVTGVTCCDDCGKDIPASLSPYKVKKEAA